MIYPYVFFLSSLETLRKSFMYQAMRKLTSGVNSINAHKNILVNLRKCESRLIPLAQAHEIQHPLKQFYKDIIDLHFMIHHKK